MDAQSALLRTRFGLAPEVAAIAARHAGGSPALAVELVEAWWQRNLLKPGRRGWEALDLDELDISMEVTDAWRNRLSEVFDEPGSHARQSIVVAALLGSQLTDEDWTEACQHLDIAPSWSAMLGLAEQDLIRREPDGWAWTSEPARLALRRLIPGPAREKAADACTRVLDPETYPIQIGQLLITAKRAPEAIPLLLEAARQAWNDRRHTASLAALDAVVLARRQLGRTEPDDDYLRERLYRSRVLFRLGRTDESSKLLAPILEATAGRTDALQAEVEIFWGLTEAASGERIGEVIQRLDRLIERLEDGGDPRLLAAAIANAAAARSEIGELEEAIALIERLMDLRDEESWRQMQLGGLWAKLGKLEQARTSLQKALSSSDLRPYVRAEALSLIGHIQDRLGDPETGRASMVASYELSHQYGESLRAADALNNIAEVDRRLGRLDQAEAGYRASLDLYRRVGLKFHPILLANLALVYVERGAWEQAWEVFEGCIEDLREQGRWGWLGVALGLALPSVADKPRLYDALLSERLDLLRSTKHADRDVVRMLNLAATRLEDPARRRRTLEAALTEARASGMDQMVADLEARLAEP